MNGCILIPLYLDTEKDKDIIGWIQELKDKDMTDKQLSEAFAVLIRYAVYKLDIEPSQKLS